MALCAVKGGTGSSQSDCESVNITSSVRTTPGAGDSREADKYRCLLILCPQKRRSSDVAKVPVAGKCSMGAGASSMDCSFRNLCRYLVSQLSNSLQFPTV